MEKTGNRAAGREGISAGNAGIGNSEQPNGVLECWSDGKMVKFSQPPSHPHVRRPVRRLVRRSPAKAEAPAEAEGPAKAEASVKAHPPPQR